VRWIALLALSGCSFATVHGPHGSPPQCEESQAAPLVDLALTIAAPFVTYWAVSSSTSPASSQNGELGKTLSDGLLTMLIATPLVAGFGASAVYGYVKTDRCTRAKRDYQQLMAAPPLPGPYAPPPITPGPSGAPPPAAPLPMVPPGPAPAPQP
jgi:hypothetical protein